MVKVLGKERVVSDFASPYQDPPCLIQFEVLSVLLQLVLLGFSEPQ